jgi:hypothetical protein
MSCPDNRMSCPDRHRSFVLFDYLYYVILLGLGFGGIYVMFY